MNHPLPSAPSTSSLPLTGTPLPPLRPTGPGGWPTPGALPGAAAILVQGDSRPGGEPVEPDPAPKGLFGGGFGLLPMVVIFAVFWFVMIGPERKNRKKREQMLANVKKGDEVMTSSGLYAKVVTIQDDVVVLQIADGVRAKYSRGSIQSVLSKDEAPAAAD